MDFWMSMAGSLLAQVGGPSAPTADTIWDFVIRGGPSMIPIGLVSIVALTIIVERSVSLGRRRVVPPDLLTGLAATGGDRVRALDYCQTNASPAANVLAAVLKRLGEPRAVLEKQAEEAGQREVTRFRKHMRLLSSLPQAATMLGLLGTVIGMIRTFQSVAASSEALGKAEMLAKGIYEAWTATAAGLVIAIPVLIAYQLLAARVDARTADLDRVASDWIERHFAALAAPPKPVEAPRAVVEAAPPVAAGTPVVAEAGPSPVAPALTSAAVAS